MRKWCALLLMALLSISLCACSAVNITTTDDQRIANQNFEDVLTALRSQNGSMLEALFSKDSMQKMDNFDESVEELFEYFSGEVESVDDWGACHVETSMEDGQIFQAMESTYDVKTAEGDYRFAVRYVAQDTVNPNNVGIQSLYIIRAEDDVSLEYAYWGDGKFTPGIHIGVQDTDPK